MFTLIAISIATVFGAGALLKFWEEFSRWVYQSLMPLCARIHPQFESLVRRVFTCIDGVATPLARAMRNGWYRLKTWLIGQLVYFERQSNGTYIQRIVTYFRKQLESGQEELLEHEETTRGISVLDLPAELRHAIYGYDRAKIDTTSHVETALQYLNA